PPARPEEEEPAAHGVGHASAPSASDIGHRSSDIGHRTSDIGHRSSDIGSGHHDDHGGHLHDAPPAMALALIVLAIGSIGAGFVGLPASLGGNNFLEHFLEPSFEAHQTAPANPEFQVTQTRPADRRVELPAAPAHEDDKGTELALMGV